MDPRIVFLGTPDFAVPVLESLSSQFGIVGVITQPDRPSGRGRQLIPSGVKKAALRLELEIHQPESVNHKSALDLIAGWHPDLICVAAFGQILSPQLLSLPLHGCLNLHASLLPRWRGASPINAAILAGDKHSGVTIMKMEAGLDDGPILAQQELAIGSQETAGSLSVRLAELGADLMATTIPPYLAGTIIPQPQDPSLATYARMLRKGDGELDFTQPAELLARQVRAYSPWPGTFTFWNRQRLIIHQARPVPVSSPGPGVFSEYKGFPAIGTGEGMLVLDQLQLAGKKSLPGNQFIQGTPDWQSEN
jgi:methionyl-tRNA formyltransferase